MPGLLNIPALLAAAVSGAVIVYIYRRATTRPAIDVRAEVRAEQESVRAAIEALLARIERAKRSLNATAHTTGIARSEALVQWLSEMDLDLSEAELLRSQLSAADADYQDLSDLAVEVRLVEVLALSLRASILADKYRDSIPIPMPDYESREVDSEALLREATQYSLNNSRSSIRESVV